ncbi:MAG: hypothetical protein SVU32_04530 [Candidatus Nanohaloarchaea archaeon]|nr:hypothetical protein [Candidatus Nanohaloarchaea archaeon]
MELDTIATLFGIDEDVAEHDTQRLVEERLEEVSVPEQDGFDERYEIDGWAEVAMDVEHWTFRFEDTVRNGGDSTVKEFRGVPYSYGGFKQKVENQELGDTVSYADLNGEGSVDGIILRDEFDRVMVVDQGEGEPWPSTLSNWTGRAAECVYETVKEYIDEQRYLEEADCGDEGCYDLDVSRVIDDIERLAGGGDDIEQLAGLLRSISKRPSDSREASSYEYAGPLKEGTIEITDIIRAGEEDEKQRFDRAVGSELTKWGGGGNFRVYGRVVDEDILEWDWFEDDGVYSVPNSEKTYDSVTDSFRQEARAWMQEEYGDYWSR